ncbi:hypothetical protein DMENIID0001_047840 [Sergentomyia squamirostris]
MLTSLFYKNSSKPERVGSIIGVNMKEVVYFLCLILSIFHISVKANDIYAGDCEDYPFLASLRYNGKHVCSATIRNKYLAMTTARCIDNKAWIKFSVVFGSSNASENKTEVKNDKNHPVYAIEKHPKYKYKTGDYDIAVVIFEQITFTECIKPLKINDRPSRYDTRVLVAGWGVNGINQFQNNETSNETNVAENFKWTLTQLLDVRKCRCAYGRERKIEINRMYCTEANHPATCVADDGAPLVIANGIYGIGIASNMGNCSQPSRPSVFISVHSYSIKSFLNKMIEKYKPVSKSESLKKDTKYL